MDIGTGLAIIGGKELIFKVAGPTADYIGNETKTLVEKSCRNLKRIFVNANKVLGSKADSPGQVSPRVLKRVFDDGAFCDDDLTLEYLGGVLASSRSDNFRDDRSLNFISLLESMSSYQIRAHYIFYTILREKCVGRHINFEERSWIAKMQVFVPFDEFFNSMDLDSRSRSENDTFIPHIFWGLKRLDLITDFIYRKDGSIMAIYPQAKGPGIVIQPTLFGIELYMWANGHSDIPPFSFLDENIQFVNVGLFDMPPGAVTFSC